MADDPPRQPVVLRIKVRYGTADAFVERFAPYVARAGLFLRSKTPKAVGTEVRFELRLSDESPVLVGMGVVRWAREPDPEKPYTPPGMAIEFTRVTKESRGVILKMLELRRALGLVDGPRGLPAPPDDDVAVIAATTAAATAAAVMAESGPVMMTGPVVAVVAVETAPVMTPEPERAPTRPASAWNAPAAPTQLEPLAARPRRPPASELVASMSASSSSLTSMDNAFGDLDAQEADVPGILARARAMVGHDLDGELANLLDQDAAPVAISIDEASAGLASLFGTAPVSKRNRRADDSVPTASRPAFSAPPPVTATAAVTTAAATITADLFAPVAPEPADTAVEPPPDLDPDPPRRIVEAPTDADSELRAAEAEAEAAAAVAALTAPSEDDEPPLDPERTRVVNLNGLAELTGAPPEGATRVVSLDALAAASRLRDSDERTAVSQRPEAPGRDDDRTRVVPIRTATIDDDARTRVLHARDLDQAIVDELDETLDFDRPARPKVPRDFADEPERDTSVRMRPLPPSASGSRPIAGRPARRTSPPPPPGRRLPPEPARRASSPVHAPLADDSHDDDVTPPPVDPSDSPTNAIDLRAPREPTPVPARLPRAESSGSFELDDLVAELSAEAATPVPIRTERSAALDGLGRSLAGDALDADGIMADLDDLGRRRAPDGPFPDLASFADPPSAIPRRSIDERSESHGVGATPASPAGRGRSPIGFDRADSLDAALAALGEDDDDDDSSNEERTHFERPSSHPPARKDDKDDEDDDDSLEIEIEVDE